MIARDGLRYDADRGKLTELQTISTLPGRDFKPGQQHRRGAGPPVGQVPLRLEPRARQHRDLRDRRGEAASSTSSGTARPGARRPADFGIDPTGRFLLAANQDSDTITSFASTQTGKLTPTGQTLEVAAGVREVRDGLISNDRVALAVPVAQRCNRSVAPRTTW